MHRFVPSVSVFLPHFLFCLFYPQFSPSSTFSSRSTSSQTRRKTWYLQTLARCIIWYSWQKFKTVYDIWNRWLLYFSWVILYDLCNSMSFSDPPSFKTISSVKYRYEKWWIIRSSRPLCSTKFAIECSCRYLPFILYVPRPGRMLVFRQRTLLLH